MDDVSAAVIETAPDAIIVIRPNGAIIAFNPAAEQLFGRVRDMVLGTSIVHLIPTLTSWITLESESFGSPTKLEVIRADGRGLSVELTVRHLGSGSLRAVHVRDLTSEQRAGKDQKAQDHHVHNMEKLAAMNSLLAGVAHELNNPLAILVAQSTVLRDKAPTSDVERRAVRIHDAAQRAGRIVKSFLSMARQKAPVREPADLNTLMHAALELVAYGFRSAGIVVETALARSLPTVSADHDLIRQVFVNLLINTQDALLLKSGDRHVWIRSHADTNGVVVEIEDDGPGVQDDIVSKIFEPYMTTKPSGTGIGLSLSRSILEAHGATIDHRQPAGRGAVFRIALPSSAFVAAREEVLPKPVAALSVLVVDDENDVAESLAELIELFGHHVQIETSPLKVLDLVQRQQFDMVITDFRMPALDGNTLRKAITNLNARLGARTAIMTGDTVSRARGGHGGVEPGTLVLEKPFSAADVRALLERVAAL